MEDEEFPAEEIDEGGGDDEAELGDQPTGIGVKGVAEEGTGEDAGEAADEVDEGEEGEFLEAAVAAAGEDPEGVGGVGDEITDGEGPEVGVDLVPFEDFGGGAVEGGEPVGGEPPGGEGVGEGGDDAAESVFGELDDERGVLRIDEAKRCERRMSEGEAEDEQGLRDHPLRCLGDGGIGGG